MIPMLNKHTLIMAALMASMTLTACGKKTDVMNPPPPTTKQTNECTANCDQGTSGDLGGGLPDENDSEPPTPIPNEPVKPKPNPSPAEPKPTSPVKPVPAPPAAKPTTPAKPVPAAPAKPATPAKPADKYPQPPVEKVPTTPSVKDVLPAPGDEVVPAGYRTNDANNVTNDDLTKRLTGGAGRDGLVYTSSSTDGLLNYLRARNERVGYESRQQNLQAAASIVSAKLVADRSFEFAQNDFFKSVGATITLKVQEGGDIKVYNLAGSLASGQATWLSPVSAGNGYTTTGRRPIKGTLKCVDFDGGCENSFARIEIGAKGSSGIVYVVFRNSKADLYFHLPAVENYSGNPEFRTISDYMISTIKGTNTTARNKVRTLGSWEVVNGRSGFLFTMKGYNDELLSFAGPLLAQQGSTAVNAPLSRVGKDETGSLDLWAISNSKLNYANTIGDARLIANNGLGQIRLGFTMRQRNNYHPDLFAITVMRIIKPIVELEDENLK